MKIIYALFMFFLMPGFVLATFKAHPMSGALFCPMRVDCSADVVTTDPEALLRVAAYLLHYSNRANKNDMPFFKSPILDPQIISLQQMKQTLQFIINTIKEDKEQDRDYRILDSQFLTKNFSFIRWCGDRTTAHANNVTLPKHYTGEHVKSSQIKLTSYAIFRRHGSFSKTNECPYALYGITSKEFRTKLRTKYTKQEILSGIFEHKYFWNHVKPLVWLSREDLEEALMQGSVIVVMPNGESKLFNVSLSNKFSYDKKIVSRNDQKKYWFFNEIKQPSKSRLPFPQLSSGITFAGDAHKIGLGKIIALRYKNLLTGKKELKLGVLSDYGSAFSNNLYQLDLFAGIVDTQSDFKNFIRQFPNTVEAYILKKKA